MARKTRKQILYDGCYAHVMSRAVDGRFIFKDDEDFEIFLKHMRERKAPGNFLIHHYCLMHTHFHILVKINELKLFSQALQIVKWQYTHWHNRKYKRMGPVWRERFKSQLIENEKYLYACGLYIEHNPVEAGLVRRPKEWKFSSSRHYFAGCEDDLIDMYGEQQLPSEIDVRSKGLFTEGDIIGSELFKIYRQEELCKYDDYD